MSMHKIIQPEDWAPPKGYSNGIVAEGRTFWVGGQVGWDKNGQFAEGLTAQIEQALSNIVAVLTAGGAGPENIVRMTWYFLDLDDYEAKLREIGAVYRRVIGKHFPVMAAVQVVRLVERKALVEIEATAVVP